MKLLSIEQCVSLGGLNVPNMQDLRIVVIFPCCSGTPRQVPERQGKNIVIVCLMANPMIPGNSDKFDITQIILLSNFILSVKRFSCSI